MSKCTTIHATELESSNGLKKISRTYSCVAFGALEKRAFLVDPEPRFVNANNSVRNRAKKLAHVPRVLGDIQLGQFTNGAPAFDLQNSMLLGEPIAKGSLNPEEWSVFTVVEGLAANGTTPRNFVLLWRTESGDVIAPQCVLINSNLGPENDQIILYENSLRVSGQPQRVGFQTDLTTTGPNLIKWTFSTKNGCAIYLNGRKVDENKDDKRPLTAGYTAPELAMFLGMRGKVGITGGYNLDFNDPINAGDRQSIERYCAWYYDIPALKELYPMRPDYFDLDL